MLILGFTIILQGCAVYPPYGPSVSYNSYGHHDHHHSWHGDNGWRNNNGWGEQRGWGGDQGHHKQNCLKDKFIG